MCEGLVDKMGEEGSRGTTDDLIMKILVFKFLIKTYHKNTPTLLFRLNDIEDSHRHLVTIKTNQIEVRHNG